MKTLFTTLQKVLAVCLFITLVGAGTANSQGIIPPDDPADLQNLPLVFNVDTNEIDWEDFTMLPFEGAGLVRLENPDQSGINTTDWVIEYKKGGAGEGGQPWAGFFYRTQEVMEINDDAVFRLQVWSPRADITYMLKLELAAFPDVETPEMFQTIEAANEWVTLEWDLSGVDRSAPWDQVVMIADLQGPAGDAGDNFTWYIDNFEFDNGEATSINDDMEVPSAITLEQNYPNPFNPTTNITFTLSENAPVTLEVYNVLGNRVATLVDGEMRTAGSHTVSFDAMNLSSGIYMYRLSTPSQSLTRTMSLIK
ncbi:MAG: T9SS type A sorting domain-containing protein [Balneolia bacterium]|nr:T9SS type A sorting domain-containing protein [Balneolia bacterium]